MDSNNDNFDNVNAFELLMSANKNRQKPTEIRETTVKHKLHNALYKHMVDRKCCFAFTMSPVDVKNMRLQSAIH